MKFGTLLELNSNVEWFSHYVDYDALKKLFPSTPLDPTYLSTLQHAHEESSLLPLHNGQSSRKWATPEEFRAALDKERNKVVKFYESKFAELQAQFRALEDDIALQEERDLAGGLEPAIQEEDEEDEDGDDANGLAESRVTESENLLSPRIRADSQNAPNASRPKMKPRSSFFAGFGGWNRRKVPTQHEADILEASMAPSLRAQRSRSMSASRSTWGRSSATSAAVNPEEGFGSPRLGKNAASKKGRRSSDLESSQDAADEATRRLSMSSASSHERDLGAVRRRVQNLGLMIMDPADLPAWAREQGPYDDLDEERRAGGAARLDEDPYYVWTATNDHAQVLKIGFKKRIAAVWLDAFSLKQYVDLNLTAFEKILKKYDKNTNSKLKKDYVQNEVLTSLPYLPETKEALDHFLSQILLLYRRIITNGDETLAKDHLRSQLRERVVVDRETVWTQMVAGRRAGQAGAVFRSVSNDAAGAFEQEEDKVISTPLGKVRAPKWIGTKGLIFILALGVLAGIVWVQPFERVEESNCLAMLVFCTILWATEAIPLFVTSLAVPMLVVLLRVLRSSDGKDTRMAASDATKYIFSQMFSPTIMLLIGGFTIAAVLSKTRLDVMTATRILNAAGTKPSVVLLVLMCVATFASMWISNVAAPTLCYALIKPITDQLHPKSVFSKCLVIAIALASNIGGQASPISSPQNLIALGSMSPPLSWPEWFAISIPVASISVLCIWAFLHINYRWESDLQIPKMRKNTDSLTLTHWYVLIVAGLTIALWCVEKSMEGVVGDMGIIAIIPLLAFFGTGILSKDDFHSFHWSIVFLAMGGIALGKATLSSGLLDKMDHVLERLVEGMGLYSILAVFSLLSLVIATFISHTIAAVLLVPIAQRIGDSLEEPHPRLLIMATALICSAGMGLPVSGFPNMTAITQENTLRQRFIGASDFLKNGIPASILATFVIITVGYAIMRALGL